MSKIQKITKLVKTSYIYSNPESYKSEMQGSNYYYQPSKVKMGEYALNKLEEAYKEDLAQHELNIPLLEINQNLFTEIKNLMESIGIPSTYRTKDPKSRARYPKYITVSSGWMEDVERMIVRSDGIYNLKTIYDQKKQAIEKYIANARAEEFTATNASKIEAERKKKERAENVQLIEIILRYDLDKDSEWEDIYDELRSKNKRLNLACAMLETREDWKDGFDSVGYALYTPETEEDEAIIKNVGYFLSDKYNDRDGRCFRDCEWNYSRLFASIEDQQLVTDTMLAKEKVKNYY